MIKNSFHFSLHPMKMTFIFSIIFFMFSFTQTEKTKHIAALHYSSVQLEIGVKTNTFCFSCNNLISVKDTLKLIFNTENNQYYFNNNQYKIPVHSIDCHNSARNNDMQKILKADKFPFIIFKLNNYFINKKSQNEGIASVSIIMAGIEKNYMIDFSEKTKDDFTNISGVLTINLNDFNIFPPSKLFGMIQIDKMINIKISSISKFSKID